MKNQLLTTMRLIFARQSFGLLLCVFSSLAMMGCNQSVEDTGDIVDELWLSGGDEELQSADAPSSIESSARLGIQLKKGDKFPLQKTVEKTLTLHTLQGEIVNHEQVKLFMSVTVDEIRGQNKKFLVRYNQVQFTSNANGQNIVYDSQQPPYPIPDAVLAYHGMVNNGFSFWVGPDNKITDIVDFDIFMQRCLAGVPKHKADLISDTLAQYSGQDGIANFVDDTIGLLPYDSTSEDGRVNVQQGESWTKPRHYTDPVPMTLKNKYTVKSINDTSAEIVIEGDVVPSAAVTNSGPNSASIQVNDGYLLGACTIDLKTGLPLESHIDHLLNMTVQVGGHQFKQEKRVVTSIRMFPQQNQEDISRPTVSSQRAPKISDLKISPVSLQNTK